METVITRDTDIFREYLAALDARERGLSPLARLAATVKLARLRRELNSAQLEATDEDVAALRREVDERLDRSFVRRFEARPWGARLAMFLILVLGQQLMLALALLATMLFVKLSRRPVWWNPALPHEEPVFLVVFIFLFFFVTPMLALGVLFGGRYFTSWRKTLPATFAILVLSVLGTYLVFRSNPHKHNPVQRTSSLEQFVRGRGLSTITYQEWVAANWLMNDPKFQRDYESYLRKGPGRWITSNFKTDAAWTNALPVMNEYLDGGQDPDSFREWLKDYLDRNKIYSEDRVEQEVEAIAGEANQRFLGVWQVEPYLKERDERIYRAYLGEINIGMKKWGLISMVLFMLLFLLIYLTGPALSAWERMAGRARVRARNTGSFDAEMNDPRGSQTSSRVARLKEKYYSFPERREISTLPFFDTPFRMLSNVHHSFVRLAIFTSMLVFGFWMLVYALDLATGRENAPSQVSLMQSHLLFGGPAGREIPNEAGLIAEANAGEQPGGYNILPVASAYTPPGGPYDAASFRAADGSPLVPANKTLSREELLALRLTDLEQRLDDYEYQSGKKIKEQNEIIASQRQEIDLLKSLSSQLQETITALPSQIAEIGARASAAEARAGEILGEVGTAKQQAENIEKQMSSKLGEVESRAARATEQIGRVEDQASVLAARTEALEKELDRRAGQVEARTEELGERTAGIKENEERFNRLQRVAFTAIVANIKSDLDDLERRVGSTFYRLFNKGEAERDVAALRQQISQLTKELGEASAEQNKDLIGQLEELGRRVEQIAARLK